MKNCFWIWDHDFTKWEITDEGEETSMTITGIRRVVAKVYEQRRTCKKCGLLETRLQKTT